jgi:heme-degrading monooxygenase HmoA
MGKHVTFFRMQVKPGQKDAFNQLMTNRQTEEALAASGWEMSVTGTSKNNPDEIWGSVVWDTSERYYANAESPQQNAMYGQMRALLASDPEWFDCDVLADNRA